MPVRRGDIFFANLNPAMGSEQGGVRPVVVLQNDVGNRASPTTIVAPLTSRAKRARLPTHVRLGPEHTGLPQPSIVLLEQVRTIDRLRLGERVGRLDPRSLAEIDAALRISLGLPLSPAGVLARRVESTAPERDPAGRDAGWES